MVNMRACLVLVAAVLAVFPAMAQPRPDDHGGLGSYPVPASGGPNEFRYCVVYAKRAWRVANLVEERAITLAQARRWATVALAYSGQTLEEGSSLIEDTFSECFAQAGERQRR
jgi:hypothetical protein